MDWLISQSEQLDFTEQPRSNAYRRRRHCQLVNSLTQPEYFAAAGMSVTWEAPYTGLVDLFTIRVDPPRSSMDLATAYNNGTKLVWDGLSTHHLIYVSGDSILYSRSEDPAGDTWSDAEFVGFVVPGQYPAIALAPDGYPRAVWSNGLNLYYSKRSDTGWQSPPQEWLFL